MKHLLIVLFIYTTGIAQENNPLDFYPYHVGDVWQYITYPEGTLSTGEITKIDTVNSFTHLVYYNSNIPSIKIILDSSIIYADSNNWFPLYKLSAPLKSYWVRDTISSGWVFFKDEYTSYVFDRPRSVKLFYSFPYYSPLGDTTAMATGDEYLVKGIGNYKYTWEGGETILIGCIIDGQQYGTLINIEDEDNSSVPTKFNFSSYPNPFNSQTNLAYTIPKESMISLRIYDILGEEVDILFEGEKDTGQYLQVWNPASHPSGVYLAVFRADDQIQTTKLIYLK